MNTILNGRFEEWGGGTVDAQPDFWADYENVTAGTATNNRESSMVYSGNYALRVNAAGIAATNYKGVLQTLPHFPMRGKTYNFSAWVKNDIITNGVIKVYVIGAVLGTTHILNVGTAHANYTLCSGTITVPLLETSLAIGCRIYAAGDNCSGIAYIDSVAFERRADCAYCEQDDVKRRMGQQWTSLDKYDELLEDLILSASRLIDKELYWPDCHFAAGDVADQTRYFDCVGGLGMWIPRCFGITTLDMDQDGDGVYEESWIEGTDFVVWPYDGDSFDAIMVKEGASILLPVGQRRVQIIGQFGGYEEPPQIVKEACAITVARWFKRGMQAYQDTGALPEMGQLVYTKALDPDVIEMLRVIPRGVSLG